MNKNLARHIPTLDGWRAIAILLVVWCHFGTMMEPSSETYWKQAISRFGVNGVPIFFAISGLLITKLLLEERDRSGVIDLSAFYLRRCFRILPPLIGLLMVLGITGAMSTPLEFISSVLFFRNYLPDSMVSVYTNHLWSLSVEEHFYLFWPALLIVMIQTFRRNEAILWLTLSLALGFGLWRTVDLKLGLVQRFAPVLAANMRTDFRIDAMLWGCVAAFLLHDERFARRVKSIQHPIVQVISLALCIVCIVVPGVRMGSIWVGMLMPWILLGTITHPDLAVIRVLDWAPVRWVGRISYSIYLWQQFFLVPAWEHKLFPAVQGSPLSLAYTLIAACASYYFLEKPCIQWGRTFLAKVNGSKVVSVSQPQLAKAEGK